MVIMTAIAILHLSKTNLISYIVGKKADPLLNFHYTEIIK